MEGNEQIVQAYGVREIATGIGICPRTTLRRGYGGAWGATRSTSRRSQLDCNRTIRKKTMSNLLLSQLSALQRLMSSAEPRCAPSIKSAPRRHRSAIDYHRRTGFPKPPEQMRGAARDFEVPRDMRTPEALRPFPTIPIPSD